MSQRTRRRRHLLGATLAGLALLMPGCATLTGMVTGAFTGAVDAPAQVYRYHQSTFEYHPEYWIFNALLFFPLGLAAGPLAGMAKGAAIDIQVLILGDLTYEKAFSTYRSPSIWRPYTIHW